MAYTFKLYVKSLDLISIESIIHRFKDLNMDLEFNPKFGLNPGIDYGYQPFKLKFNKYIHASLVGQNFRSGFEMYIDEFDLEEEKQAIQPKKNILQKLFSKKNNEEVLFAPESIEEKLKKCNYAISFVGITDDIFSFRMTALICALLCEQLHGVSSYEDEEWYLEHEVFELFLEEVERLETSIELNQFEYSIFEKW